MTSIARLAYRFIGPLLFIGLVWFADLTQIGAVLRRGNTAALLIAASISLLVILVKAWRWRRLMRYQGIHYGFLPVARYYAISCALGAWTPARLGDFSKAIAVKRDCRIGLGRAASAVIADRLLDGVVLGGIAALGAGFLPGPHSIWLAAGGLAAVGIGAYLLFHRARGQRMATAMRRGAERIVDALGAGKTMKSMGATSEEVGAAIDGLVVLVRPRGVTIVTTVAATLLVFIQGYLVAWSLDMSVGFWELAVALSAVSIASLIPVSVGGFGTREATLALFLGPGGATMPEIIGFSLAYFLIISGTVALIGALAWLIRPEPRVRVLPEPAVEDPPRS